MHKVTLPPANLKDHRGSMLSATMTNKFKDREKLIVTLHAIKRRLPPNHRKHKVIANLTLHLRQGYNYRFVGTTVHCYWSHFTMY